MIIKTNSWHYRWYSYWLKHGGIESPVQENLCHYSWGAAQAPLTWLGERLPTRLLERLCIVAYAVFLVALVVYLAVFHPLILAAMVGCIVAAVVVGVMVGFLAVFLERRELEVPGTVKLLAAYVVAKKRRVCPLITFEEAP